MGQRVGLAIYRCEHSHPDLPEQVHPIITFRRLLCSQLHPWRLTPTPILRPETGPLSKNISRFPPSPPHHVRPPARLPSRARPRDRLHIMAALPRRVPAPVRRSPFLRRNGSRPHRSRGHSRASLSLSPALDSLYMNTGRHADLHHPSPTPLEHLHLSPPLPPPRRSLVLPRRVVPSHSHPHVRISPPLYLLRRQLGSLLCLDAYIGKFRYSHVLE